MTLTLLFSLLLLLVVLSHQPDCCHALNIVIAGGTGRLGPRVAQKLSSHKVTLLSRNKFLASAPSRVTEVFGWVGQSYLDDNPHVSIRDYDGGDLLEIVGQDFLGWQEDTLTDADVVLNLVGGYTNQREMATERIVRESLRVNPQAVQITVSPREEDLGVLTPGARSAKVERLQKCEEMVKQNCLSSECLRLEAFDYEKNSQVIVDTILKSCSE